MSKTKLLDVPILGGPVASGDIVLYADQPKPLIPTIEGVFADD